ncbi:hypothetical protein PSECIP111951_01851 [Pseudoalteromonas holothuriae]|uniref:DUF3592 domain-containing protein n=1 Tax=Pseudoalteromonas holothuriae TaxID=2963714 RepID=A0A9W4QYI8_9GAMM|nr:hypothetical protein PSECIP111951_01851 [Pseudoalteromonas sp. CIP111951]CAH9058356.1 hypothetical protein PSECIP111854_02185 [Pseudoalteromonas sp. CIP111854]
MIIYGTLALLLIISTYVLLRYKIKKRAWRQVQVEGITRVKQHTVGSLEVLAQSSILIEFTYQGEKHCCQTAFRPSLYESFLAKKATFIYIDPHNPEQCLHNAQTKWRYIKLWLFLTFLVLGCVFIRYW